MLLSAVSFARSKSKTILVKMVSQAGTGYSFNTKRSRLREKLTLLRYDPVDREPSADRVTPCLSQRHWAQARELCSNQMSPRSSWQPWGLEPGSSASQSNLYTLHHRLVSESKSPLCGTEKNTLPLNNGLEMNLIYK
ncbi:large ribosomal subunit protein bL33m isoform X1 [Saccopteryx bilineata]|uniref:large ribosomal subunit protein bL33m isoform X1 n=1 Tax=Saccopteryx bilineata TaxID=59482 RepID=UPI00338DD7F1